MPTWINLFGVNIISWIVVLALAYWIVKNGWPLFQAHPTQSEVIERFKVKKVRWFIAVGGIFLMVFISPALSGWRPRTVLDNPAEPLRQQERRELRDTQIEIDRIKNNREREIQDQREQQDAVAEAVKDAFKKLPDAP